MSQEIKEISPEFICKEIEENNNYIIVDVRTPMEYDLVRSACAISLPLDEITNDNLSEIAGTKKVAIICKSGSRSKQACQKLGDFKGELVIVTGGTDSWVSKNLPTINGEKKMSLERQVRIATGGLVLFGFMGSNYIPSLGYITAFVGAGLVFAGITDTCAMGMILAKMPWNKRGSSSCCSK